MERITIDLTEDIILTAFPLFENPSLAASLSQSAAKLQTLIGYQIEIKELYAISEYRILAEDCNIDKLKTLGTNHDQWRKKAKKYAGVTQDFSDGFARINVTVPGEFRATAWPQTSVNSDIPDAEDYSWWLHFHHFDTGKDTFYLIDPYCCDPKVLIQYGANHQWFAEYALGKKETNLRPYDTETSGENNNQTGHRQEEPLPPFISQYVSYEPTTNVSGTVIDTYDMSNAPYLFQVQSKKTIFYKGQPLTTVDLVWTIDRHIYNYYVETFFSSPTQIIEGYVSKRSVEMSRPIDDDPKWEAANRTANMQRHVIAQLFTLTEALAFQTLLERNGYTDVTLCPIKLPLPQDIMTDYWEYGYPGRREYSWLEFRPSVGDYSFEVRSYLKFPTYMETPIPRTFFTQLVEKYEDKAPAFLLGVEYLKHFWFASLRPHCSNNAEEILNILINSMNTVRQEGFMLVYPVDVEGVKPDPSYRHNYDVTERFTYLNIEYFRDALLLGLKSSSQLEEVLEIVKALYEKGLVIKTVKQIKEEAKFQIPQPKKSEPTREPKPVSSNVIDIPIPENIQSVESDAAKVLSELQGLKNASLRKRLATYTSQPLTSVPSDLLVELAQNTSFGKLVDKGDTHLGFVLMMVLFELADFDN